MKSMELSASLCGMAIAPSSPTLPRKPAAARCRLNFPFASAANVPVREGISGHREQGSYYCGGCGGGGWGRGRAIHGAGAARAADEGRRPPRRSSDGDGRRRNAHGPAEVLFSNLRRRPWASHSSCQRSALEEDEVLGGWVPEEDAVAAAAERDGEKAARRFTMVVKFEGSSLASAQEMSEVADLVLSLTKDDKERPIVLLSAMGNTTNKLIGAAKKAVSFAFSSVSEIQEVWDIVDLHLRTIDELGLDNSIISGLLEKLEKLFKRIASMGRLTLTARDELVSIGECMSTTIFTAYLNKLGKIKARQYDAFDIGVGASILELTCDAIVMRLLEDWIVDGPAIPVLAGFLGKGWKSYTRGGNDLIAATIAKALGLSKIQVWKDVDVLLTYDLTSELVADLQIINSDDLEKLKELDSGTYGTVYHAKWKGTDVAVKFLKKNCFTQKPGMQEKLEHAFWQENKILSKLRHPNVLPFYGVVVNVPGGTLGTVTEFVVDGSLRHVLQHKANYLDDHKRLIIATDAALGMEYMHARGIVHFDLKSGNLLVNLKTRPTCKVGDFGLSKIKKNALVSGFWRGTVRWMAPELMNVGNVVSEKVDVYSFGIVMWEIITGEVPYNGLFDDHLIASGVVNNTLRPHVPANCDPEWSRLMEQCWAHDPAQRPDFREIVLRLQAMSTANYSEAGSI